MEIVVDGPTFYGRQDEDRFFAWIYSLPAYERVTGIGRKLHIVLCEPVDDDTVKQLLVICRRWFINITPLLSLRRDSNRTFALWDDDGRGPSARRN